MDLFSQPRDHYSFHEELIAQEDHDEVNDQSEPDFGDEVAGVGENTPGIHQDVVSMLVVGITVVSVEGDHKKNVSEHAVLRLLVITFINKAL